MLWEFIFICIPLDSQTFLLDNMKIQINELESINMALL